MAAALDEDEIDNDDYYSLLNVRREVTDVFAVFPLAWCFLDQLYCINISLQLWQL